MARSYVPARAATRDGPATRPARSVTVPIRRVPGWCCGEQRRRRRPRRPPARRAEAAAHVEDLPHLGVGDVAELAHELEDRRHRQRVVDLEADAGVQAQQVLQPAAGDVREPVDAAARSAAARAPRARRSRSARAARRRACAPPSALGPRVERHAGQRAAGERVAVGVQAGGRQADQRVARARSPRR